MSEDTPADNSSNELSKQEPVIDALRVESRPGSGSLGPVNIGIQLPPSAAARIADSHPKEFLDLTRQVDDHNFAIAQKAWDVDHAQKMERLAKGHIERTTVLANDKVDREENRKYALYFIIIAAALLLALLGFAGWTGDKEVVKAVIEKVGLLVGGLFGGYGIRSAVDDRRRKRTE